MPATEETYEILYNTCYGGFSLPDELVEQAFKLYPPESEVGKDLWGADNIARFVWSGDSVDPSWDWYYLVEGTEPFAHGYDRVITSYMTKNKGGVWEKKASQFRTQIAHRYLTKDKKAYYFLSYNELSWRRAPEIIAMVKSEGLIGKKWGHTELSIAYIPVGYDYDIHEYDGKESVCREFPHRQVIGELLHAVKTGDQSGFGPLTKKLVDGLLPLNKI